MKIIGSGSRAVYREEVSDSGSKSVQKVRSAEEMESAVRVKSTRVEASEELVEREGACK